MISAATADRMIPTKPDDLSRVPAHDESIEACLIGAILWDPKSFYVADEVVRQEDFYVRRHRAIFTTMRRIAERGDLPDVPVVLAELTASGGVEDAGGREYLAECFNAVESGANVGYYARKIRNLAHTRAIALDVEEATRRIRAGEGTGAEIAEALRAALDRHEADGEGRTDGIAALLEEALHEAETPLLESSLFPTGLDALDQQLTIRPGNFVIVAGRPSMGKSSAIEGFASYAAVEERIPVAYFSLEMSSTEVATKLVAARSGISLDAFRPGNLGIRSNPRLVDAMKVLEASPIFIDDAPALTPSDIRGRARRLIQHHGVKAIFIDHLGKVRAPEYAKGWSVTETIGAVACELKNLAKTLGVPVIAACQLNREADKREGNRPMLSDLRQSGEIEQEADAVVLLYRAGYYKTGTADQAEFIVAKQRMGRTGSVYAKWTAHCCRFDKWDGATP